METPAKTYAEKRADFRARVAARRAGVRTITPASELLRRVVALGSLEALESVSNFRSLRGRDGQTWSFTTIDGLDRPHLHVLVRRPFGPAGESSFSVRVVNAAAGHESFETTVDELVRAVEVWDGNARRQRARN